MTQLDPRTSTEAPAPPQETSQPGPSSESPFNWHVSLGMFIGLVVLFATLFGLRALHIWPPDPGQDPEIVAAFATRAVLQTQAAVATPLPAATVVVAPAAAPTIDATPAPPSAAVQQANATPAPIVVGTLAAPPIAAPATNAPIALATPETAAKPQIAPTAFETSAPAATATALTLPAAGAPQAPTATSAPPAQPEAQPTPVAITLPADLAQAILQGYSNYWTIRVQAMRYPEDLTVDLPSVMAGNELVGAQQTLAQYRDSGNAFETHVKHQVWITSATSQDAIVVDQYVANTTRLDPSTKDPLDATPMVEQYSDTFRLQNIDGTWKVVREDAGGQ
jgi:hypothetical protein